MTGQHVSTKRSIYVDPDLADWKPLTKFFYRYLYENDHAHGITGIGKIAEKVMVAETGMTRRQIAAAIEQIGERVAWFADGTYWVKARAKHTCYTQKSNLHPKFVAGAQNFIHEQSRDVVAAFAERYPEIIGDVSPIDRRCIGEPVKTDLPTGTVTVAVAGTVAGTGTGIKDPPPTSPQDSKPPVPLPRRVGGFFNRSGKEGQREDFYVFLAEILSVTDARTTKAGLTELNGALADRTPANIVAYARPIFERRIGNWLQERHTEQQRDGDDRRAARELRDRLRQKQQPDEEARKP